MINYLISCFWTFFDFLYSNVVSRTGVCYFLHASNQWRVCWRGPMRSHVSNGEDWQVGRGRQVDKQVGRWVGSVNLKPSDSFHSSLTHRKYVSKCNIKSINILNCSTSNSMYLITCCRCGLEYVGEIVQSLRDSFHGHRTDLKNPFAHSKWFWPLQKCKLHS